MIADHAASQADRPLFLYVPFNAPHTPLQAPPEQIARNQEIKNRDRRIHAAMVTSMDDAIGRILAAAGKHLPAERTLVFFCSDNGGINQFGSNGKLRGQKGTLYEGGIRVPTVIRWKGTLQPGIVKEPLHVADLYPTLLGLAGAEVTQRKPLDGKNAWPAIAEGRPSPHEFLLHNVTPFQGAIRMGSWKLVHNGGVQANATNYKGPQSWELFDLDQDPYEKKDLSAEKPELVARMKEKLAAFKAEAAAPHLLPNEPPDGFVVPEVWGQSE